MEYTGFLQNSSRKYNLDVRYIQSEIIDKWGGGNTVRNHLHRFPLHHTLPSMQKTGHTIPILKNK